MIFVLNMQPLYSVSTQLDIVIQIRAPKSMHQLYLSIAHWLTSLPHSPFIKTPIPHLIYKCTHLNEHWLKP